MIKEHEKEQTVPIIESNSTPKDFLDSILSTYWGPRITLGVLAAVYATNFPLGALLNDNLPASAATCARMTVAALALSPFLFQLKPNLRLSAVLCGCCTSLGYVTQSLALADTDPARVSFLGSLTVIWCPLLEAIIDSEPRGITEAPQTWLAAVLCVSGVGILESGIGGGDMSMGDVLAVVQAIGFGSGVFWTSRMLRKEGPEQALPITATLLATTALISMVWCYADGWIFADDSYSYTLPGMLAHPTNPITLAVLWTGLVSTSLNFYIELNALGRMEASEASVLLASEPLWAAVLASTVFGSSNFGMNDFVGGGCIVAACCVNALLKPQDFFFSDKEDNSR